LKIILDKNSVGRETMAMHQYALKYNIPCIYLESVENLSQDEIPVGSVEFVERALGAEVKPNYFPDFTQCFVGRNWWIEKDSLLNEKDLFIKPADKFKRFTGYVRKPFDNREHPPWFIQDVVCFLKEFRYYISCGEVVAAEWYPTEGTPDPEIIPTAPNLPTDLKIPKNWSGTLDFGETDDKFLLVESHPPFACGWYGESNDFEIYAKWIIDGWKYLLTIPRI
jgi:hypothetical protein